MWRYMMALLGVAAAGWALVKHSEAEDATSTEGMNVLNATDKNYILDTIEPKATSEGNSLILNKEKEELIRQWAPLVWLHSEEKYYPSTVLHFLQHVKPSKPGKGKIFHFVKEGDIIVGLPSLPEGKSSWDTYFEPKFVSECRDCVLKRYLKGEKPSEKYSPTTFAVIHSCDSYDSTISQDQTENMFTQVYADNITSPDGNGTQLTTSSTESENEDAANATTDEGGNNDNLDEAQHDDDEEDPFTESSGTFAVSYWMFYPYNVGKSVCTADLFNQGRILVPTVLGKCLAKRITLANHVGDWEHITIQFKGKRPNKLHISTHNFGAYYTYDPESHLFRYTSYEIRDGQNWTISYAQVLKLQDNHPVVYSALGSHGLWAEPGSHQFHKVPSIKDETDKGTAWNTWQNLEMMDLNHPENLSPKQRHWMTYEGHWGNKKNNCFPSLKGLCEEEDGPLGIPRKRNDFPCHN